MKLKVKEVTLRRCQRELSAYGLLRRTQFNGWMTPRPRNKEARGTFCGLSQEQQFPGEVPFSLYGSRKIRPTVQAVCRAVPSMLRRGM